MRFTELKRLWNRRRKGAAFKSIYNSQGRVFYDADSNSFVIHTRWLKGVPSGEWAPLARMRKDDTLELLGVGESTALTWRGLWRELSGFGTHHAWKSRFKNYACHVRFFERGIWANSYTINPSAPMLPGLVVDTYKCAVVKAPADEVRVLQKDLQAPIYEYTRKVVEIVDVILRVQAGALRHRWANRNALSKSELLPLLQRMDEDSIGAIAAAAADEARARSCQISESYFNHVNMKYTKRTAAEVSALQLQADKKLAARRVREKLREVHNTYDIEIERSKLGRTVYPAAHSYTPITEAA